VELLLDFLLDFCCKEFILVVLYFSWEPGESSLCLFFNFFADLSFLEPNNGTAFLTDFLMDFSEERVEN
jgi:hypothetical protein